MENSESRIKLTKAALNKFIVWSNSRYNSYCDYGNKKENVDIVFKSLKHGCFVNFSGVINREKTVFIVQCAGGLGENGNGRYWKTKQSGGQYEVDCTNMSITEMYSKRQIFFLPEKVTA